LQVGCSNSEFISWAAPEKLDMAHPYLLLLENAKLYLCSLGFSRTGVKGLDGSGLAQ
jgi:hypothetical protein